MKTFSARETEWLQQLDGMELAGFRRRAFAFVIDWTLIGILLSLTTTVGVLAYVGFERMLGHPMQSIHLVSKASNLTIDPDAHTKPVRGHVAFHFGLPEKDEAATAADARTRLTEEAFHIAADIVVPCLYFGLFLWRSNGRTPGKRLMKIRVVSLLHPHMSFWHSVERALGYGAAALEAGFGFFQYFLHPYRRCAQDRLAETIVVTERSYAATFPKVPVVPDEPTAF